MFFSDPELIRHTEQMCVDDPVSANIREALLDIELEAHHEGWNSSGPTLFQLDLHHDTCQPHWQPCDEGYNDILELLCAAHNNSVERAILGVARHSENVTAMLRNGTVSDEFKAEADWLMHAATEGLDLAKADKEGYEFSGYGLIAEAWGVSADPEERERGPRSLGEHPRRHELRDVFYATRTGELWICERRRSHTPKVVVLEHNEENTRHWSGAVFNALSRMVNAVLADTVPIWPATPQTGPPPVSRPNPLIRPTS